MTRVWFTLDCRQNDWDNRLERNWGGASVGLGRAIVAIEELVVASADQAVLNTGKKCMADQARRVVEERCAGGSYELQRMRGSTAGGPWGHCVRNYALKRVLIQRIGTQDWLLGRKALVRRGTC